MIINVEESKCLCEWLLQRGLGIGECAQFLANMECGDTFAVALMKVFNKRKEKLEEIQSKICMTNWNNPVIA